MLRIITTLAVLTATYANICTTGSGSWSYQIADGVTDFAHGGLAKNKSFYCFDGCLETHTCVQNYKVKLAGSGSKLISRGSISAEEIRMKFKARKALNPDDDPNAETCIDPVLRQDVTNALNTVKDETCKAIVKAISLNVNRQGWVYNCVFFEDGFGIDSFYEDNNFCLYNAFMSTGIFDIRLAAIDTS